ncbi:hypothetical protein P7H75_05725 [Vagococcus carniphilus]|uniref:hypothetical protein n=1 Tax=Vagococcus carniphilus TaxID=218144 RepID=UPI002891CA2A|nr:hypothetical protein [Vagococcus carniphilus]MDT2814338.1 hypothetical protein [Vagococcus carniphilus]
MKFLEFKDTGNIKQTIPLLKSFFRTVQYPLTNEMRLAQLVSVDNEIIPIVGTDFRLVNIQSVGGRSND